MSPPSSPRCLQMVQPMWRSELARPAAAMLYTGSNKTTADAIGARLFREPLVNVNASTQAAVVAQAPSLGADVSCQTLSINPKSSIK